jgi:D-alanyl-D-alanine carboxypeptidase (penicillin-binding protein 5/6)
MKINKLVAAVMAVMMLTVQAAAEGTAPQEQSAAPQGVKAKSAVLAEASTGTVLSEYNSHEKLSPASITKIMTELLVLEAIESGKIKWNDTIKCSAHSASMGGSDIWIAPGEEMSVNDLFKAMAVNSANDAAVALAETVAGSEQAFVDSMNAKAKALGMNDSHFVNCTGLDADGNYTSAYDVMLMSRALISHKNIFNYSTIWMDTLRGGKTGLYNTNKLIHSYQGANGLKTGSTSKAGYCLSATALRGGMQLIAVVMGCTVVADRFSSASALLDYGFANYSCVKPQIINRKIKVKVLRGENDEVEAAADDPPEVLVKKGEDKNVTQKLDAVTSVVAPVERGQQVGTVTLWYNGKNVGSVAVRAASPVARLGFAAAFAKLFSRLVAV